MRNEPTSRIESLGVYLPPHETTSASRVAGIKRGIKIPLERFTGIRSTRRVAPGEYSFDLACRAIERALDRSRFRAEDIGLLIACNISKYDQEGFVFPIDPNTATRLRKAMGFRNAVAFDLNNACAGMFTGILIADCFLHATDIAAALVVSGEYISHLSDAAQLEISSLSDSRLACLTLGDSGAAVVLERSPDAAIGFHRLELSTLGAYSSLCRSAPALVAGRGAVMHTESAGLLKVGAVEGARHFVRSMEQTRWNPETVDHVIPHQVTKGAPDVLVGEINSRLNGVKLPRSKIIDNLATRGNTSTTTHFVALHDQMQTGRIGCGDRLAFSVVASGLTVGTALYVLDDLPQRLRTGADRAAQVSVSHTRRPGLPIVSGISVASVASTRSRQAVPRSTDEIGLEAAEICLAKAPCRREDIGLVVFGGVYKSGFLAEPSYASILAGKLFPHASLDPGGHAPLAFDLHHGPIGFLAACEIVRTTMARRGISAALFITAEFDENRLLEGYPRLDVAEVASAAVMLPAGGKGFQVEQCEFFSFEEFTASFAASAKSISPVHVVVQFHQDYQLHLRTSICRAVGAYLSRHHAHLADFDEFYFPQISSEFLRRLGCDLGLPHERTVDVTVEGKDLSTSSVPCILEHVGQTRQDGDGRLCLAVSAGPGINVGCAVVRG